MRWMQETAFFLVFFISVRLKFPFLIWKTKTQEMWRKTQYFLQLIWYSSVENHTVFLEILPKLNPSTSQWTMFTEHSQKQFDISTEHFCCCSQVKFKVYLILARCQFRFISGIFHSTQIWFHLIFDMIWKLWISNFIVIHMVQNRSRTSNFIAVS